MRVESFKESGWRVKGPCRRVEGAVGLAVFVADFVVVGHGKD